MTSRLTAAGFKPTEDGHLEVPPGHPVAAEAALAAVKHKGLGGYGGRPEVAQELSALQALRQGPEELLPLLERVLENVRRYPTNEKYRCINLSKPLGQKVLSP